jgi:hypothetical protein
MVARLGSALKTHTSQLIIKATVASLVLLWMRLASFPFWLVLLFLAFYITFYTKPAVNIGRFFTSGLILAIIPFHVSKLPGYLEIFFSSSWGIMFFFLIGVKNLILLKRNSTYRLLNTILIALLCVFLFRSFSFWGQIIVFVLFLSLLRESYVVSTESNKKRSTLIASVESILLIEFAWVTLFLSLSILENAMIIVLSAFAFYDVAFHYLSGDLSRSIVIKNMAIFAALSIIAVLAL